MQERRRVNALEAYRIIVPWVVERVAGTTVEQLRAPTPCTEWDVAGLLHHLLTTSVYYALLAEERQVDTAFVTWPNVNGPFAPLYREATARGLRAWAAPGALDQPCSHSIAGSVPGFYALSIHASDALVHGWDLATATGQNSTMDPVAAQFGLDTFEVVLARDKARRRLFEAAVPAASDDAQSRLVAFTGRAVGDTDLWNGGADRSPIE